MSGAPGEKEPESGEREGTQGAQLTTLEANLSVARCARMIVGLVRTADSRTRSAHTDAAVTATSRKSAESLDEVGRKRVVCCREQGECDVDERPRGGGFATGRGAR